MAAKKTTAKKTTTKAKKEVKKPTKKTTTKKPTTKVKEAKVKEENVEKVEKTQEEIKEEFFDAKEDKESVFNKVMNVILWIVLIVWMVICLVDFFLTQKRQEPIFTFKHETVKYEDGEVDSYLGLGYKIYNYKRKCFNGTEYGPFWSKDRSIEDENCSK